MKQPANLPLVACTLAGLLFSCSKAPSSGASPLDSGPPPVEAAAAPPELSARVVITGGPITQDQAQAMAMQFAAKRWPQYHPRFAVALREQKDWKVLIQFQEPGVGGMVIYDLYGAMLDAGTSKGEH